MLVKFAENGESRSGPGPEEGYLDRLVDDDALGAYLTAEFGSADTFAVERHAEGHPTRRCSSRGATANWWFGGRPRRDGRHGPRRAPGVPRGRRAR